VPYVGRPLKRQLTLRVEADLVDWGRRQRAASRR
jgi:uncharacterized protein (DUF4415 family)